MWVGRGVVGAGPRAGDMEMERGVLLPRVPQGGTVEVNTGPDHPANMLATCYQATPGIREEPKPPPVKITSHEIQINR